MSEPVPGEMDFEARFYELAYSYENMDMLPSARVAKIVAEYARDGEIRTTGMVRSDYVRLTVPLDSSRHPNESSRVIGGFAMGEGVITVNEDTLGGSGLRGVKIIIGHWFTNESGKSQFVPGRVNSTDPVGYRESYGVGSNVANFGSPPLSFEFNDTLIFGGANSNNI